MEQRLDSDQADDLFYVYADHYTGDEPVYVYEHQFHDGPGGRGLCQQSESEWTVGSASDAAWVCQGVSGYKGVGCIRHLLPGGSGVQRTVGEPEWAGGEQSGEDHGKKYQGPVGSLSGKSIRDGAGEAGPKCGEV